MSDILSRSLWEWMLSNEASNLGTFLLGITAFLTLLSFWRFREEKRLEKFSNIAGEALNYLDHFVYQATDWMQTACSTSVYSFRSKSHQQQLEKASEIDRKELLRIYKTDPREVSNFCSHFNKEIMSDFFKAKNKSWQLGNAGLDSKFEELETLLKHYPGKVAASLRRDDREQVLGDNDDDGAKLSMFINTRGPDQFNTFITEIKPLLRQPLLYNAKKDHSSIRKRLVIKLRTTWHTITAWFKCPCHH